MGRQGEFERCYQAIESIYFVSNNIEIISINCSRPEDISNAIANIDDDALDLMKEYKIKIGVYANGYEYIADNWSLETHEHTKTRKVLTPEYYYNTFVKTWLNKYPFIGMIGGCCCMLPDHIRYIVKHIEKDFPNIRLSANGGYVTNHCCDESLR